MELDRNAVLDRVQSRAVTIDEFNFDKLIAPPLCSLLSMEDIDKLYYIATSVKYSGNARKKYKAIDDILKPRGFTKLGSGTNRVVYKFLEDDTFVIKVAADAVGIKDNPKEFINQNIFKPFVTKVFEVDPTGVVAVVERVLPITSREEFLSIADDVFEVINEWFLGKYVMADIGTKFFMNWGTRRGFGPVLLDFPYSYELDGNKLYCSAPDSNSETGLCGGEIDYDDGFNFLHCTKCGVQYRVKELAKAIKEETVMVKGNRRKSKMKVAIRTHGTLISEAEEFVREEVTKVTPKQVVESKPTGSLKVSVVKNEKAESKQKKHEKYHGEKHYDGSNRGIVRDNSNLTSSSEIINSSKQEYEDPKITQVFTAEQLHDMIFEFSSHDVENDLLVLKTADDVKICLDLKTIDKTTYDLFFEQSDYMVELEEAKKDLLAKEESLEVEKAANATLFETLEASNKGIEELQETIDLIDDKLAEKDEIIDNFLLLNMQIEEYSNNESNDDTERTNVAVLTMQLQDKELEIERLKKQLERANSVETEPDDPDADEVSVPISLVKEKDLEIEQLNKTILEMTEEITKLSTEASDKSDDEISTEKLKKELEREKSKVNNQKADYEAKMKVLEDMLQKANETIDGFMTDEESEVPILASSKEINFDDYNGFSCIHGTVTSFNGILNIIDEQAEAFEEDHHVIAFPDGNGGFIKGVDNNIIVAASVNDANLDDLTIVGKDHYNSSMKRYEALKKMKASKATPVGVKQQ